MMHVTAGLSSKEISVGAFFTVISICVTLIDKENINSVAIQAWSVARGAQLNHVMAVVQPGTMFSYLKTLNTASLQRKRLSQM